MTNKNWDDWVTTQRGRVFDLALKGLLIFSLFLLIIALIMPYPNNSRYINAVHLAIATGMVVMANFLRGLSNQIRGKALVAIFFALSIVSLSSAGITGNGRIFLIISVFLGALLTRIRITAFIAVASLAVYLGFAFHLYLGNQTGQSSFSPFTIWSLVQQGFVFGITLGIIVGSRWLFEQVLHAATKANLRAQSNQDDFRNIVERSSDGIIILGGDQIVRFVNAAACTYFNRRSDDFIGNPFPLAKKSGERFETPIQLENGIEGIGIMDCLQTEWEDKPAKLIVVQNITAQKQIEQSLHDTEIRFNQAFQASPVAMSIISPSKGRLDINQAFLHMYGVNKENALGTSNKNRLWVDEQEYQRAMDILQKENSLRDFEFMFRRKNGEIGTAIAFAESIKVDGETCYLTSAIDITERKQAEDALNQANIGLKKYYDRLFIASEVGRTASENLDPHLLAQQAVEMVRAQFSLYYAGLFLIDENNEFAVLRTGTGEAGEAMLKANHRLRINNTSMIGWCIAHRKPRIALNVGKDSVHFNNPLLPNTRSELALPLISRGEIIGALTIQSEEESAFTTGNITAFQVMADLLANAIRNAQLYDLLQSELRERKRVQNQLRKLNEELENRVHLRTAQLEMANKELEAFSYSVSHDLRAPLRSMDGFSRILLEEAGDSLSDQSKHYLKRIREAAQQMGQLINDILRLSRISRSELQIGTVNLSQIASDYCASLQANAPQRKADFLIQPGLTVEADYNLMRIALENLLNNAWKFSQHQQQTIIEFGVQHIEEKSVFYIRDNGVGFDIAYADKLFTAFQRLHLDDEFEGTGIGLTLVFRIIQRHDGQIWADAKPDQGATFFFTV